MSHEGSKVYEKQCVVQWDLRLHSEIDTRWHYFELNWRVRYNFPLWSWSSSSSMGTNHSVISSSFSFQNGYTADIAHRMSQLEVRIEDRKMSLPGVSADVSHLPPPPPPAVLHHSNRRYSKLYLPSIWYLSIVYGALTARTPLHHALHFSRHLTMKTESFLHPLTSLHSSFPTTLRFSPI